MWKCAITIAAIVLTLPTSAAAQKVYRCTDGDRTTYSQTPCTQGTARIVNVAPNSIASFKTPEPPPPKPQPLNRTQPPGADEIISAPPRLSEEDEIERRKRFREATTVLPGSRGGLTRKQRETAAGLARTQREREILMR